VDYLEAIRQEVAYIKPHQNDDLDWYNEGLSLLDRHQFEAAELKFKELIMSQPEHHDGYHGLALVYQQLSRKDKALFFIREAMARAEKFVNDGSMDQEALDWLEHGLQKFQDTEE
jgi:tetratricopeptide (TPR) repeat protein